jgi:serine/threonine-protein kinase
MTRSPSPDGRLWERIEDICFGAMQLGGEARSSYLDAHCGDDPALLREVEALLRASETRPDFLSRPVVSIEPGGMSTEGPGPVAPERIGPYRIVRPLGHGGMGDVYLAVREGDGFSHTVAVKVIRRGFDTDRILRRFRQERRILAGLTHPNIASLVDGGATADGRPYFVMEFVEGDTIDEYCEQRGLSVRARLELVRVVCSAVQHAHQNLVVHRDIKPANILVTREGVPKLLDFGIGKVLADEGEDSGVTVVEERALTPEYAAPEQLAGGPITTATDVFGLGMLLYRVLTGRLPWETRSGGDRRAIEARTAAPLRPSVVGAERAVPRELDAIVLKALSERPEERYPGPLALADDLARFLAGRPVLARAPSPLYLARKFILRNRVGVSAAAIVTVALIGTTGFTWRQSQRVAAERDKALEVRGFLLETFGAAGPDRATGDPVTARALLDRQAATVMDQYAGDPALRAEMMMVLAEGYERLGLYTDAESWAARVVAAPRSLSEAEFASAQTLLGWVRHQQGRSQEAEALLVEAVVQARAASGGERMLARALNDLGVVYEALGDYPSALAAHQEAMGLRRRLFGADHRSVGVSRSNIAVIQYRMGDVPEAVAEAERALAIIRRSFGADHQRAIIVQNNLAVFKLVEGDVAGAESDYRELWERQARLQGTDHPVTVRVMISLASVLRGAEKWAEAESVLREVLAIESGRADSNPVDVGFSMAALGDVVSAAGGRHEESVRLIEDGLRLQLDALGIEHIDVAQSQSYLSRAFERVDSLEVATRWQRTVVETLMAGLGPEHAQTRAEAERLDALQERLEAR